MLKQLRLTAAALIAVVPVVTVVITVMLYPTRAVGYPAWMVAAPLVVLVASAMSFVAHHPMPLWVTAARGPAAVVVGVLGLPRPPEVSAKS